VLKDAVAYVRPRTRTYITANADSPRDDPQVKHVVGELSAIAFAGRALVAAAASVLHDATADPGAVDGAEIAVYQAQVRVLDDALRAANLLFEVGGASATYRTAALDRHWRNARTVASHNPAIYKYRQLGDWELGGVGPNDEWKKLWTVGRTSI
jgi:alkylation response protein AidB-like acyl-CoA dehydrogenase